MIRNYLTVALRTLRRHPGYAFINLFGLALGITCCLLIGLYVRHELSYDRYHTHADRVHRVARAWYDEGGAPTLQFARISAPIGPALEAEFPEVQHAARIMQWGSVVSYGDQHIEENKFFFVEPDLFALFSIPFLKGTPETALDEPNTVVLTESMAAKYFGEADPIGMVLRFDDAHDLQVTGVVQDAPSNTHFHYDFLASWATLQSLPSLSEWMDNWGGFNNFATYVLLAEGAQPADVEARLPAFLDRHYTLHIGASSRLFLQPLPDIHLHSHLDAELEPNGHATYVYLFSAIAFFILLIACFNYMNLAAAQAARRFREVGVRKALGAARRQLISQFLGESLLLALLALAGAVGLTSLLLPAFNAFTGKSLDLLQGHVAFTALGFVAVAVFVGLVAGSYPAFVLSRLRPAAVLKGAMERPDRPRFRTALVVLQFTLSIVLIIGAGVIYKQLAYLQNKNLGFNKEQLVMLEATNEVRRDFERVRTRLEAHPGVRSVTASQLIPSFQLVNSIDVSAEVGGRMQAFKSMPLLPVDHAFTETYGMDVVAGRSFSKDRASDSTQAFLLNETAVRQMGWAAPEDAVGKAFVMHFGDAHERRGQVIGVVKDFHFESLHERIAPLVLFIMPDRYRFVTARIAGEDVTGTLAFLEQQWQAMQPRFPFDYTFIDQQFAERYEAEQQLGQVVGGFTGLALLIACLGLFGLAAFTAEQRTKEIGIRKVLGATVTGIVALLSRDFARLVLIAFVLAVPLAYVVMRQWLSDFAYHTDLGVGIFLMAGTLALVVALATVSYQAIHAALADPVKSLRYE